MRRRSENGSATVEFAILLPAVVLLMSFILSVAATTVSQLRVVEAARAAVRLAAVGHSATEIREQVISRLPGGELELTFAEDGLITAVVSSEGPLGLTLSSELSSILAPGR